MREITALRMTSVTVPHTRVVTWQCLLRMFVTDVIFCEYTVSSVIFAGILDRAGCPPVQHSQ